jgi:hypothetical protein
LRFTQEPGDGGYAITLGLGERPLRQLVHEAVELIATGFTEI